MTGFARDRVDGFKEVIMRLPELSEETQNKVSGCQISLDAVKLKEIFYYFSRLTFWLVFFPQVITNFLPLLMAINKGVLCKTTVFPSSQDGLREFFY